MSILANQQAACERTKDTRIPRVYDVFTSVFVWMFILILPFFLASLWPGPNYRYMLFPVGQFLAFMYAIVKGIGESAEFPFENEMTDVPLTSICVDIERELVEIVNNPEVIMPERHLPTMDGYLY